MKSLPHRTFFNRALACMLLFSATCVFEAAAENPPNPKPSKPPKPCPTKCPDDQSLAGPSCSSTGSLTWAMKLGYSQPYFSEDLLLTPVGKNTRGPGVPLMFQSGGGGGGGGGGGNTVVSTKTGFKTLSPGAEAAGVDELDEMMSRFIDRGPINRLPVMIELDSPFAYDLNRSYLRISSSSHARIYREELPIGIGPERGEFRGVPVDQNGKVVPPHLLNLNVVHPVRQVITDSAFADISDDVATGGFHIRLWRKRLDFPSGFGLPERRITSFPMEDPVQEVIFQNRIKGYGEGSVSETWITNIERFGSEGEHVTTQRYHREGETFTITTHPGRFDLATGIDRPAIKKEIIRHSGRGARLWDYTVDRETFEATQAGGVFGTLVKTSHTREIYVDMSPAEWVRRSGNLNTVGPGTSVNSSGAPVAPMVAGDGPGGKEGGKKLTSIIHDVGGKNLTTRYEYDDEGRLKLVSYPDGSWQRHGYPGKQNAPIITYGSYSPWLDLSSGQFKQGIVSSTVMEEGVLSRTVTLQGRIIAQTKASRSIGLIDGERKGEVHFKVERFDGTGWQKEERLFESEEGKGRPLFIRHFDGTLTTYAYQDLTEGSFLVIERKGAADAAGKVVVAGTETRTSYNPWLQVIEEETRDIASGIVTSHRVADSTFGTDSLGRPVKWIYNGDPDDYSIQRRSCCDIEYSRDRSGATTRYFHDGLKRVHRSDYQASSDAPIIRTNISHSGLTTTTTETAGGVTRLIKEVTLDGLGEPAVSKAPDEDGDGVPETTTYATTYPSGGGTVHTTTFPDGSTSIKTTYIDGRQKSVTGTAVPDRHFTYGLHDQSGGGLWTRETRTGTNGTEWTKTYADLFGREFKTEFPDGAVASKTYHPATAPAGSIGQLATVSDASGLTTQFDYDAEAELVSTTEPMPQSQSRVVRYQTDVVNDAQLGAAERSQTWVNEILVNSKLTRTDGFASRTESFGTQTHFSSPLPVDGAWTSTSTSADNQRIVKTYTQGRLAKSEIFDHQNQSVSWTRWTYDAFGQVTTETDSRTGTRTYDGYTESGNLLALSIPSLTVSSGFDTTTYGYDAMGRTTFIDQPNTLDADGNGIENITRTSYHPGGEIAAVWGDQTNPTYRRYDEQNRLVELRTYRNIAHNVQPIATTGGYDLTTWIYDSHRGWLIAKRDAAGKGADYTYDSAGRLESREWARVLPGTSIRLKTTYDYDAGKLVATIYNDNLTPNVSYHYDAFGRQTEVIQNGNSWTYAYDPVNLTLDQETIRYDTDNDGSGDLTRTLDRSQDHLLRPTGYQLKNGNAVETDASYTYDPAGRLASVSGGGDSFSYGYEPNSPNLIRTVTGPVHTVTNSWAPVRDVLVAKENRVGSTLVSRYGYTVNELGQRTALATSGSAFPAVRAIDWGYNARGEVTSAAHSDAGQSRFYQYDPIGNRKVSREGSSTNSGDIFKVTGYTANALNQYVIGRQITEEKVGFVADEHDADGNLLAGYSSKEINQRAAYSWDGDNRLVEAKIGGTTVGWYQYDPFGRRIAKIAGNVTTYFIYDGWNLIAEFSNSALLRAHLWGQDLSGSLQGAGGVGGLLSTSNPQSSTKGYPLFDGNGNVTQYLDGNGTLAACFEYDPFGKVTVNTNATNQFQIRFSTKYQDAETGLNYYGYRYYDPQLGRWPLRDPIFETGGINLYWFVGNNGVMFFDLFGLAAGECYKSAEEAAFNALKDCFGDSLKDDKEYGGWIIQGENGCWTYTKPKLGERDGFDTGEPPDKAVAGYHTHGKEIPKDQSPEYFSKGTKPGQNSDEKWAKENGKDLYVATPEGTFGKMTPGGTEMFKNNKNEWRTTTGEKTHMGAREKGGYTHPNRGHYFK